MRVLTLDMMNDDCVIPKINENIIDGITLKIKKRKRKRKGLSRNKPFAKC